MMLEMISCYIFDLVSLFIDLLIWRFFDFITSKTTSYRPPSFAFALTLAHPQPQPLHYLLIS